MEEDKLHKMAYDAYMKTLFFTEHQKAYIQGFKDGYNSSQLEPLVMVKLADVISFMKDWAIIKVDPDGEYEEIELKTVNYLIKAIERKFSP